MRERVCACVSERKRGREKRLIDFNEKWRAWYVIIETELAKKSYGMKFFNPHEKIQVSIIWAMTRRSSVKSYQTLKNPGMAFGLKKL